MSLHRVILFVGLILGLQGGGAAVNAENSLPESAKQHAYEASPDVYELIGENDKFRVMLATWKPGQSDEWHTHHGDLVNYNLTDCKLGGEMPGGKSGTLERKKGDAGFNVKGDVHKVTNIGTSDCVLLIVERK